MEKNERSNKQWCVRCQKFHEFATRNWKYDWRKGVWERLAGESQEGDRK